MALWLVMLVYGCYAAGALDTAVQCIVGPRKIEEIYVKKGMCLSLYNKAPFERPDF